MQINWYQFNFKYCSSKIDIRAEFWPDLLSMLNLSNWKTSNFLGKIPESVVLGRQKK